MGALGSLGLSELEEDVYEALVELGSSTAADVAFALLGVSLPRIRGALGVLVDRGMVARTAVDGRFIITPPQSAIEALALRREEELVRARAYATIVDERLRLVARRENPTDLVELVEGRELLQARVANLERSAHREVLFFDLPPYALTKSGDNPIEPERLAGGVSYRTIYERRLLEDPFHFRRITQCINDGEQARVLAGLPLKLMVVDRSVAVVPLVGGPGVETDPASIFVRPSVLLDSLVALFEALWTRSVPLRAGFVPNEVGDVDPEVVAIVGMLASGLKDEAIARQLGVNVRTVRRRVRHALDVLGVESRFQAGVRAAELGLL
ncbi:MAG: TrmB family transcriptional regulator [Acidimicrobiales bacterium]